MFNYRMVIAIAIVTMLMLTIIGLRRYLVQTDRSNLYQQNIIDKSFEENADFKNTSEHFASLPKPEPGDWLDVHSEPGQTFKQFLTQPRKELDNDHKTIYLQPLWDFDTRKSPDLEQLKQFAENYFKIPVKLLPDLHPPTENFSPRFNKYTKNLQVNASEMLEYLYQHIPEDAFCILGITMIDLYPQPDWNYVFGFASYTQGVGVFSFARYSPSFYGDKVDSTNRPRTLLRSCKMLAHETGHMFGLAHCTAYHCIMNGCNNLKENDAQPIHLCPVCLKKLQYAVGFDRDIRYQKLGDFYLQADFIEQFEWIENRMKL